MIYNNEQINISNDNNNWCDFLNNQERIQAEKQMNIINGSSKVLESCIQKVQQEMIEAEKQAIESTADSNEKENIYLNAESIRNQAQDDRDNSKTESSSMIFLNFIQVLFGHQESLNLFEPGVQNNDKKEEKFQEAEVNRDKALHQYNKAKDESCVKKFKVEKIKSHVVRLKAQTSYVALVQNQKMNNTKTQVARAA